MPLVNADFADTFDFVRGRLADYRTAEGDSVTAGIDEARFDHDEDGAPLGLLVEGRPEFGFADLLTVKAGDWEVKKGTVLHYFRPAGEVAQRFAWYTTTPRATANACLARKGHHLLIAYVPQYLKRRGDYVRWNNQSWNLGAVLIAEPDVALGPSADVQFIEG